MRQLSDELRRQSKSDQGMWNFRMSTKPHDGFWLMDDYGWVYANTPGTAAATLQNTIFTLGFIDKDRTVMSCYNGNGVLLTLGLDDNENLVFSWDAAYPIGMEIWEDGVTYVTYRAGTPRYFECGEGGIITLGGTEKKDNNLFYSSPTTSPVPD